MCQCVSTERWELDNSQLKMDGLELDNSKLTTCALELDNSVFSALERLGIRGTQVKSSIQDIVDEVAPIKKPPYGVEGRFIRM